MRILIGCQEICGWISLLEHGFKQQGLQIITLSSKSTYFKDAKYTLEKEHFERDYFQLRTGNKALAFLCFNIYSLIRTVGLKLVKKDMFNMLYRHATNYLYNNTDMYLHIWESLDNKQADLKEFKKRNVKIVSWFVGDDIRHYPTALKEFNIDNEYFLEYTKFPVYVPMRKLRMHEKYSDVVFSVPDQSSLALRPYFHLQIPIDLSMYTFKKTGNTKPLILHIPTAPLLKGSPIFFKVMDELKAEGLDFEFKTVTGISNKEVRALLTEADILLDELYMHGPGMLGIEAMASGCCVVVKYLENSPDCFKPPVVSVDVSTVKEKIRALIINQHLREELIDKGLEFVRNTNAVDKVCSVILNKLNDTDYDYYPTYFRNEFEVSENLDVSLVNELTALVNNEPWYKTFVKTGERMGLTF